MSFNGEGLSGATGAPQPMFAPSDPVASGLSGASNVDLDDLFRDCYFGDFPISGLQTDNPDGSSAAFKPKKTIARYHRI